MLSQILLIFLFVLIALFQTFNNIVSSELINYNENKPCNFIPLANNLNRRKRQTLNELHDVDDIPMNVTFPPDTEIENDETTEHTYYNKTVYYNNTDLMKIYYVDMENWIARKDVNGTTKHDHLTSSYRKAASVKLKFEFPFYGHKLTNLTIATGGFCYVGDQTHSWLAATQYIAPLMANFDTMTDNATIMYGDDGERMIVEWSKVKLKDNRAAGFFTFQVSLKKNGDIYFVYKNVPISPKNISDLHHPCKLGISDAYLFNHKVSTGGNFAQSVTQSKRIIHEYHRISIDPEKITSNTIVILTALPTCFSFSSCEECSQANLKSFHCSWCSSDLPDKAFCSDQTGLNRRRQEWVEGNCSDEKNHLYCDLLHNNTISTTLRPKPTLSSTNKNESNVFKTTLASTETIQHPEGVVSLPDKNNNKNQNNGKTSALIEQRNENSGLAFLTLLIVLAVGLGIWLLYAFYNPHTASGQFLIKYRPSKWQIPSSHVRYSASVHM